MADLTAQFGSHAGHLGHSLDLLVADTRGGLGSARAAFDKVCAHAAAHPSEARNAYIEKISGLIIS